jgi:hypothetical protein
MAEKWKVGVARDARPDGSIRHSQVTSTFGPGALVDFVEEAAVVAGLSWWARGQRIEEDRLLAMLTRQEGYENVVLYAPPPSAKDLDDSDRKWIKAFRFPEWFVCQNERCWTDGMGSPRKDGGRPRRLLYVRELEAGKHKCKGSRGTGQKVQPIRFTRACRQGHVEDLDWIPLVHRAHTEECTAKRLWMDEAGGSGDLSDVYVFCSGCGATLNMTQAARLYSDGGPTLGHCNGRRPWLGNGHDESCGEPMRLLLRSASNAYFPVQASVIHIPDPDGDLRDRVSSVYELIKSADDTDDLKFFIKKQDPVRQALEGLPVEAVFAEVVRRRNDRPIIRKKVKEAEIEILLNCPQELATDQPDRQTRFYARTLKLPTKPSTLMEKVGRLVVLPRLTDVRAIAGFTRFESKSTDVDGELDIGAGVARLDDPLTWLPAVENSGEGFFFSLKETALAKWERELSVRKADDRLKEGFKHWQKDRIDRQDAKPDFAGARFTMLHSLSHLLITAVSLECGYSASSIRERLYVGAGGSGILLYTASPGAEGSLGGLVEVGRHLERYLRRALELGRLCSNDPVCAAHQPDIEDGAADRPLEGASCHGCLLISEPSCERMNLYLDRTLVIPTVVTGDAAFFKEW